MRLNRSYGTKYAKDVRLNGLSMLKEVGFLTIVELVHSIEDKLSQNGKGAMRRRTNERMY